MAVYDIFLENKHSNRVAKIMIKNNKRLINYLSTTYFNRKKQIRILEIGPGKGYLKEAVLGGGKRNLSIMR